MSSNAPIPDVAQVLVNWTIHDVLCQNALFFRHWSGPIDQASLDLLRDRIRNSFRNNFLNALGAGTVLRSVECKDRTVGAGITSNVILNRATLNPIPAAASSIALGLIQYTSFPAEVHPSRAFVGGLRLDKITGNFVDATYANELLALWATNNASHGPFGWHHVRVSLFSGGLPRLVGVADRIIGYSTASLRVSDQQRRLHPEV